MALTFSTLRKPVNRQVVDAATGLIREEWGLYFQGLTERLNSAVGELGGTIGDVTGPASSTNNNLAAFDGTDGKLLKDSGISISNVLTEAEAAAAYQPLDADLTALAALGTTGQVVRTGAATYALRTLTGPAAGITVTNGDGVSGNPTLALANDLAAIEGLGSTGFATRTGSDAWAQRTITAGAGISVTNGDGVSGNPTLAPANDLAALEGLGSTGIAVRSAADTWVQRAVAAGTGISVSNGDGVSGNPTISTSVAPGVTTIASGTLPAAATLDITNIPQTYSYLTLIIAGISHNSGSSQRPLVQVSFNNGSSFSTTDYRNSSVNVFNGTTFAAPQTTTIGTDRTARSSAQTWNASFNIYNYTGGSYPLCVMGMDVSGTEFLSQIGHVFSTSAINALRITFSGGNIDAGTYVLYGHS